MRFTGHLDLYKTWERTIRRADIPLTYTQGFNPRPRINLAAALPLGFTGENEVMDIWLEKDFLVEDVFNRLENALPPGLALQSVKQVDQNSPSLQFQLTASDYRVTILNPASNLQERLEILLNRDEILRERRGKKYNLRPLIIEISIHTENDHENHLSMRLSAGEGTTGRPDEVVSELGILLEQAYFHRERLIFD